MPRARQPDWLDSLSNMKREAIAAHIEEGFLQAERGQLIDGNEVERLIDTRHSQRNAGRQSRKD